MNVRESNIWVERFGRRYIRPGTLLISTATRAVFFALEAVDLKPEAQFFLAAKLESLHIPTIADHISSGFLQIVYSDDESDTMNP